MTKTIQERFETFHDTNPWVLDALEELTAEWLEHGNRRLGIRMLQEVLRWQHGMKTVGDDFKLNDNYTSRYVRLMIERNPEWADVFSLREIRTR